MNTKPLKVLLECLAGLFVGICLVLIIFGIIPAVTTWIASKSMYAFIAFILIIILLIIKLQNRD